MRAKKWSHTAHTVSSSFSLLLLLLFSAIARSLNVYVNFLNIKFVLSIHSIHDEINVKCTAHCHTRLTPKIRVYVSKNFLPHPNNNNEKKKKKISSKTKAWGIKWASTIFKMAFFFSMECFDLFGSARTSWTWNFIKFCWLRGRGGGYNWFIIILRRINLRIGICAKLCIF